MTFAAPPERPRERVDVVYTWVDGAAAGHAELRQRYERSDHDRNPNRYRDNLDLLRFSLRSLQRFAPWLGTLHLVTMRPQLPPWLDREAPGLRIVHHDEIFEPERLPSFNSFAIVAHLQRLPGLSQRFVYFEDDFLLGRPVEPADFTDGEGRLRVYARRGRGESARRLRQKDLSPWESAIARACLALDRRYGRRRRPTLLHTPRLFDRANLELLEKAFGPELERTRGSRFRSPGDVPPEVLYPWFLLEEGLAVQVPHARTRRDVGYLGLGNRALAVRLGLARLARREPKFYSLNDNFGERPNPRVERLVRGFLEARLPEPSRFEVC